jgi:tetracycline repressor-like protein
VRIAVSGPPAGPHSLAWFDRALATLSDTALDEGEKVWVVMGLHTLVYGELRLSLELAAGFRSNPEAFGRQYALALKRVVDPRELPALSRVVEAGVFDQDNLYDEHDLDAEFDFGLNRYLDGVAAYLQRRAAGD